MLAAMAHHDPPPLDVINRMHAQSRALLRQALMAKLEASGLPQSGVVVLQGGEEQTRYCTDHVPLFRQESYFAYLFGVKEPGFYGALDISSGKSMLFLPKLDPSYAVWLGTIQPPSFFKELYGVDEAYFVDDMAAILQECGSVLYLLYGLNTDSGNYSKPATFEGIENFKVDKHILHPVLTECRVHKSDLELDLMRYVVKVSSAAHVQVMRMAKPGIKEYQLESTFLHYCYMHGGCRQCSYTCICATGENSSVLHYGHAAAPNDQVLRDGAMALLDMGAEYHFYGSDITCSFPVNGKFTEDQRTIYEAVLEAQRAVIGAIKPGVSWADMHRIAERKILEGLQRAGCVKGIVDDMLEKRLGATFMPHGLGHLLGLDTHDPGGYPEGTSRMSDAGLKSLRMNRLLEAGMVVTVEPGCYFISALLDSALEDPTLSKFLDVKVMDKFRHFGGVRLEDDVVVTVDGCENLTKCPREVSDVEAVMGGEPWLNH